MRTAVLFSSLARAGSRNVTNQQVPQTFSQIPLRPNSRRSPCNRVSGFKVDQRVGAWGQRTPPTSPDPPDPFRTHLTIYQPAPEMMSGIST